MKMISVFAIVLLLWASANANTNTNANANAAVEFDIYRHGSHDDSTECHFQEPDPKDVRFDFIHDIDSHHRKKRQTQSGGQGLVATPIPIRIAIIIDPSISTTVAQNVVVPAVQYHQSTLQVKYPNQYPLGVTQSCTGGTLPFQNQNDGNYYCWQQCTNVTTCGSYTVPSQFYAPCASCSGSYSTCATAPGGNGQVPNADLLVFVVSLTDSVCTPTTSVAAYGSRCQVDPVTGRPTVGTINVCPKTVGGGGSLNLYGLRHTVIHELTHVLGFSYGLFDNYLLPNGTQWPYVPLLSVMNPWQTASGILYKNTTYLITPTVAGMVQSYFNCSTLPGGELEDQGSAGTALTHWEKRVFNNELMTGIYTETAFFSNITLALLQDTGWYNVNFNNAESFTWGKGLGCMYATNSCMTWITSQRAQGQSPYPFCDQMANKLSWTARNNDIRTICDPLDHNTIRFCNMQNYTAGLSPLYQYFNGSIDNMIAPNLNPLNYGGGLTFSDYCPYFAQSTVSLTGSTTNYYMACNDPSNGGVNNGLPYDLSMYGPGQVCVRQTIPSVQYLTTSLTYAPYWGAGCYTVTCTSTAVTVSICNMTFTCLAEMQNIMWNMTSGTYYNIGQFSCPLCSVACPNTSCPMTSAGSNVLTTLLNVSTANETALTANITSLAAKIHTLFPTSATAPSTCPANVTGTQTATTPSTSTTATPTTTAAMSSLMSVVSSAMSLGQGNIMTLCSNTSCPNNSTCMYLAQPYCRCVFPYYGVASSAVGCVQPNLTLQVPLYVQFAFNATNISSLTTIFSQTTVQSILFDLLTDQILTPTSNYTAYVPTSAYTTSVSASSNPVTVLVAVQIAMPNITRQATLVSAVQANVTKAINSWSASASASGRLCNFGLFSVNCSSIGVSVSNVCSTVQCPSNTYCVVYGQLYNCICNAAAGYVSVGLSGANPLVENCVGSSAPATSGPGVNCSTTPLGTTRCVCSSGYVGSPQSGCTLTANANGIALIGVQLAINTVMPASLAVTSSVAYWSFLLSMEQDLNVACMSSNSTGVSCVNGGLKVNSVANGSINLGYAATYQSTNGGAVDLNQAHAAHNAALQSYYSAGSASSNGQCTFGTIVAPCAITITSTDPCSGNNFCLANSQCVNTDSNAYTCVCLPGYVQTGTMYNMPNVAVCEAANNVTTNVGILLAIVLPCTIGVLIIIAVVMVIVIKKQAKEPREVKYQ